MINHVLSPTFKSDNFVFIYLSDDKACTIKNPRKYSLYLGDDKA